ncbi:MAG: hypothetical protein ACREVX_15015 [Clostridium sp.]|uniref:hypothetical protein n=1 Tax=Clostridium sp. TaxID=1506 RepID=UPI003D6DA0BD
MGFIDELMNLTIESLSRAATDVFNTAVISSQDNTKTNNIKTELITINEELNELYRQIGKKYVEYVSKTEEAPESGVKDLLKLVEAKIERKNKLESQLIQIEKKLKEQAISREKERFENEFKRQKETLDEAQEMEIISKEEYDLKLQEYTKRRNNFQSIRNVKKQYEFGIISYEELQMKLRELT